MVPEDHAGRHLRIEERRFLGHHVALRRRAEDRRRAKSGSGRARPSPPLPAPPERPASHSSGTARRRPGSPHRRVRRRRRESRVSRIRTISASPSGSARWISSGSPVAGSATKAGCSASGARCARREMRRSDRGRPRKCASPATRGSRLRHCVFRRRRQSRDDPMDRQQQAPARVGVREVGDRRLPRRIRAGRPRGARHLAPVFEGRLVAMMAIGDHARSCREEALDPADRGRLRQTRESVLDPGVVAGPADLGSRRASPRAGRRARPRGSS